MTNQKSEDFSNRFCQLLELIWAGHQSRLAADLDCSRSMVSMIVGGRVPPGRELLAKLSRHPDVNATWLFTGDGEPLASKAKKKSIPLIPHLTPDLATAMAKTEVDYPIGHSFHEGDFAYQVTAADPIVREDAEKVADGDVIVFRRLGRERPRREDLPELCLLIVPDSNSAEIGKLEKCVKNVFTVRVFGRSSQAETDVYGRNYRQVNIGERRHSERKSEEGKEESLVDITLPKDQVVAIGLRLERGKWHKKRR